MVASGRQGAGPGAPAPPRARPGGVRGVPGVRGVATVLAVLAGTALVRALVVVPVVVTGSSMEPTVHDGDVVVLLRTADRAAELERGDLVVLRDPAGAMAVKRVVGVPGDRVAMLDAYLTVDGVVVDEPYVDHDAIDGTYLPQVIVPDGAVWVLGDDRARSVDSRHHGPVADRDLVGRVLLHW